ncbi:MAG: hypothetical protein ACTTHG_04860 [Treponemataceae bacterium]
MEKKYNKNIFRLSILFVILFCFAFPLLAQNYVISPVEGIWGNYQTLVIDVPEGGAAFYSVTGDDPLNSGFVYDSPVLLELEGDVKLKVVVTKKDCICFENVINFTVNKKKKINLGFESEVDVPIVCACPESPVTIPEDMTFIFDEVKFPYLKGCQISSSPENDLCELLPLILVDNEKNQYRYMLLTKAVEQEEFVLKKEQNSNNIFSDSADLKSESLDTVVDIDLKNLDSEALKSVPEKNVDDLNTALREVPFGRVPFEVNFNQWTNLCITTPADMYVCLDNGNWMTGKFELNFSRETDHVIYWIEKSVLDSDTEFNPDLYKVFYSKIPSKPELLFEQKAKNLGVKIKLSSDDFTMSLVQNKNIGSKLTVPKDSYYIDTIFGNESEYQIQVLVLLDGIAQGFLTQNVQIDKLPPSPPVIFTENSNFFIRDDLVLSLISPEDVYTYYQCTPVNENDLMDFSSLKRSKANFNFSFGKTELNGEKKIELKADKGEAFFYEVAAYAKDDAGNISLPSYYCSVIDYSNFYLKALSDKDKKDSISDYKGDGSPANPYSDFSQIKDLFSLNRKIIVHLSGDFENVTSIPITQDCKIISENGSRISFMENVFFDCINSTVSIENCILEQNYTKTGEDFEQVNFFKLKNSNLILKDCEIISVINQAGAVFVADRSDLKIEKCGISLQSENYGAICNTLNSSVKIKDSRLTVVSDTAVAFTMNAGKFDLSSSFVQIDGKTSKFYELFHVKYIVNQNKFFYKNKSQNMFVTDVFSEKLSYEDNLIKFF